MLNDRGSTVVVVVKVPLREGLPSEKGECIQIHRLDHTNPGTGCERCRLFTAGRWEREPMAGLVVGIEAVMHKVRDT